ncbi:MAG: hypothetical protein ACK5L5_01525, partial [Bacteroidales bacterium]
MSEGLSQSNNGGAEGGDNSYFDQVSSNISGSLGVQVDGISQGVSSISDTISNDNLSISTKAAAVGLGGAEVGMQAMGLMGAVGTAIEGAILPLLGALGLKGLACLPISKQLDPVMGIDIHMVNLPPFVNPVPMPHPYIAILFRAKDFASVAVSSVIPPPPPPPDIEIDEETGITEEQQQELNKNKALNLTHMAATMAVGMLGATVKIGMFLPRAVAGNPSREIPHFPMGAGFHNLFNWAQKDVGHAFMGSLFTLADGDPFAGGTAHLHMSCWDLGSPSVHDARPSNNTEKDANPKINIYLPVSLVTPIPPSRQILT